LGLGLGLGLEPPRRSGLGQGHRQDDNLHLHIPLVLLVRGPCVGASAGGRGEDAAPLVCRGAAGRRRRGAGTGTDFDLVRVRRRLRLSDRARVRLRVRVGLGDSHRRFDGSQGGFVEGGRKLVGVVLKEDGDEASGQLGILERVLRSHRSLDVELRALVVGRDDGLAGLHVRAGCVTHAVDGRVLLGVERRLRCVRHRQDDHIH
jgi:hypothetical protein